MKRYLLRLLVVLAVTAAIIGLGYLWRSSPAASLVSDSGHHGPPSVEGPLALPVGEDGRGGAAGLSSLDDLGATILIGVGVLGVVVFIDTLRRRRNPVVRRSE